MQGKAGVKNRDRAICGFYLFRVGYRRALYQGDAVFICWQAVKGGAVERGESLEIVQCALGLKNFRQTGQGIGGRKTTGATAGMFFQRVCVRGRIGAEEWSEAAAWVSSKSSEWARVPLIKAAAAGEYPLLSPSTLHSP